MSALEDEVAAARAAGRRVGPFVLLDVLGRGGMGVVVRAWDEGRGAVVALKLLDPTLADAEGLERLTREAAACDALAHPGIVRTFGGGLADGRPWVAFELVAGRPLARQPGASGLRAGVAVVRDVARAMAFAHARGVIHRDLKPGNVLVDCEGRGRIIDFGLARFAHDRRHLTATGTILGTPGFMAPEQAAGTAGQAGPPADAWALGGLLYFVLCGRPPFAGRSLIETLRAVLEDPPAPPSKLEREPVDPALEALALACLTKEPAKRPTATHVADGLERWLGVAEVSAEDSAEVPAEDGARAPRGPLVALALLAGAALAATAAAVLRSAGTEPTGPRVAGAASVASTLDPSTASATSHGQTDVGWSSFAAVDVELQQLLVDGAALGRREPAQALGLYEQGLRRWRDDPLILAARASLLNQVGQREAALRDIDRALLGSPTDPMFVVTRARILSMLGDPRALGAADRGVELATSRPDELPRAYTRWTRAWARRRLGDFEGARQDATVVTELQPEDPEAWMELAQSLLGLGRADEAWERCAQRATALVKGRPTSIGRILARCAIAAGRLETARSCLAPFPQEIASAEVALARAELALAERRPADAAALLGSAVELDPGDVTLWLTLAGAQLETAAHGAGAVSAARAAVRLAPAHAPAWHLLARAQRQALELEAAISAAEELLRCEPSHRDGRALLAGLLLQAGDPTTASDVAGRLAADAPDDPRGWSALARARARLWDARGARAALAHLPSAGELDVDLALLDAELLLTAGADEATLRAPLEPLLTGPRAADALLVRSRARLRAGDAAGARDDAARALAEAGPDCGRDGHAALARAHAAHGDGERALQAAEEAVRRRPRSAEALAARALARLARGELAAAAHDAELALAREPDLPEALVARGRARLRAGDDRGRADLERAGLQDPTLRAQLEAWGREDAPRGR